jgi:hypothetical protein
MLGDTFHPWPSSRVGAAPVSFVPIPPLPLLPSKIFGTDQSCLRCGEEGQISWRHAEAVECCFNILTTFTKTCCRSYNW